MTIHRFFIDPKSIKAEKVFLHNDMAKQIIKVLRLKKGDKIVVLDNSGSEFLVRLDEIISGQVIGTIIKKKKNNAEPKTFITLYQALTPRDKFELILQKCTEIGVSRFIPIETKRSLLKVKDIKGDRLERFQKIITEAAEQCERALLPMINKPLKFEEAVIKLNPKELVLCAWEDEKKNSVDGILNNEGKRISIFIGPEGGFDSSEIIFAKKHDVITVSLGPRILRTETAAIALSSLILLPSGS